MTEPAAPTAAILLIGNEILSGRTQDANLNYIARQLAVLGIRLKEVRVVTDEEDAIVEAVNALRTRYTYVFTTGGIGPTHDDITADSVAKAFGVRNVIHPDAYRVLAAFYEETGREFNEARQRMAHAPEGAVLIENKLSRAPGFRVGNVYVMAGIPAVMRAMFEAAVPTLRTGPTVGSRSIATYLPEGEIAKGLGELQARYAMLEIGSYPFVRDGKIGTTLVLRGTDKAALDRAADELAALIRTLGAEPMEESV
ncbi:MAG: competence/damage-inducible protein A [Alphaproteobacteria bacterium]